MKRNIYILLLLILLPLWTSAQQINIPWQCGFEESDSVEIGEWVLNDGTPDAADQWVIGKAVRSEGKQSLYISADNGATAAYGSQPDIVMAYRKIHFPEHTSGVRQYVISFDWCVEETAGALYVFFDYASTLLTGSKNVLQYATDNNTLGSGLPSNILNQARYVSGSAYSRKQVMQNQTRWMNVTIDAGLDPNGQVLPYSDGITAKNSQKDFALVFVWVSHNANPKNVRKGACVDNIQIATATWPKPANLKVENHCEDSTLVLSWEAGLDGYAIEYRKSSSVSWHKYLDNSQGINHSFTIKNLRDGSYDMRVRGWKKDVNSNVTDTTAWSTISSYSYFCPQNQCLVYTDLDAAVCTFGPSNDIALNTVKADFGATNVRSLHTVNIDQNAYDIRTNNGLKIVPDGFNASVRLGNWWSPGNNQQYNEVVGGNPINGESVTYSMQVDAQKGAILLLHYAMIFEESNHDRIDQPYFKLTVKDQWGDIVNGECGTQDFFCPMAADEMISEAEKRIEKEGWKVFKAGNHPERDVDRGFNGINIWWKDWSTMGLNLSDYDGANLTITIESRGCGMSAHYGYGYFTLSCTSASIETEQCGLNPTNTAIAPEGFDYEWYALQDSVAYAHHLDSVNGHAVVVCRTAELTVPASDDQTYICRLFYKDSPDCWFELRTVLASRNPVARYGYQWNPADCINRVNLVDSSRVGNYKSDGSMVLTDEHCEYTNWTVTSLRTGRSINDAGDKIHFDVAPEGDSLVVALTTYIADGECSDNLTDTIVFPSILTPDSVIYDTICDNHTYSFAGQTLKTTGVFYDSLTNQYGCDSVSVLYLTVNPTNRETRIDTISSARLPYLFTGHSQGRDTTIMCGENKGVPATANYQIKFANQYRCDSTINLKLTVIPLLQVETEQLPSLCADGQSLDMAYLIRQGDFDSLVVHFDQTVWNYGLTDTVIYHDPYSNPVTPPANSALSFAYDKRIIPGLYSATLTFYQHKCCGLPQTVTMPLDVRYAASVIEQKWNDVLALLNAKYNGGYEFTAYQWYENEALIPGATMPYLYQPLTPGSSYSALLTRADGVQQFTCPIIASDRSGLEIQPFPSLAVAGNRMPIRCNQAFELRIYTVSGALYASYDFSAGGNTFMAPAQPGIYILQMITDNQDNKQSQRLIVTP